MSAEYAKPVAMFGRSAGAPARRSQPHWFALQAAAAAAAIREFVDGVAARPVIPRLHSGGPEEPTPDRLVREGYWDDPAFWMLMMH